MKRKISKEYNVTGLSEFAMCIFCTLLSSVISFDLKILPMCFVTTERSISKISATCACVAHTVSFSTSPRNSKAPDFAESFFFKLFSHIYTLVYHIKVSNLLQSDSFNTPFGNEKFLKSSCGSLPDFLTLRTQKNL